MKGGAIMETISERIKKALSIRNMRQSDLVEKTGIGKSSISTYLSGAYEPKQRNIYKIAKALDVSEAWLMGADVPMSRIDLSSISSSAVTINIYGRVSAGIPLEMIEDIIDTEEISEELARTGEFFGLQIHGDSMEPKISEGDIVIVRKQDDAETGDTVIATVNGTDATCKRLRKYRDGIELIATNPSYEPMYFSNQDIVEKPVRILGKVVELRAKF